MPLMIARALALSAFGSAALVAGSASTSVSAHPGRTAADGCHNDRKNGGRHCHGGKAPTRSPARVRSSGGDESFANCSEARAAGRSNIRRGEPGYAPHLDRDGDGIACES